MDYVITELSFVKPEAYEQLGTKEKFWFLIKEGHTSDLQPGKYLFKFSRPNTGEHWSEKIAEQLCKLLNIPHAEYDLAMFPHFPSRENSIGVYTKNIVPDGYQMVMGNEALYQYHPTAYPKPDGEIKHIHEHTIKSVMDYFDEAEVKAPLSWTNKELNAGDLFCGYLMLDALISNQDRHHENWAILVENHSNIRYLCPSYDHAASLGRELQDTDRIERLSSKDKNRTPAHFVTRAKSELFQNEHDNKPLTTLDAFICATNTRLSAKTYWLSQLEKLSEEMVKEILQKFPAKILSEPSALFVEAMILENKKRILNNDK